MADWESSLGLMLVFGPSWFRLACTWRAKLRGDSVVRSDKPCDVDSQMDLNVVARGLDGVGVRQTVPDELVERHR